jgi:hypothetical protein
MASGEFLKNREFEAERGMVHEQAEFGLHFCFCVETPHLKIFENRRVT